jgi:hypothetical protein
VKTSRRSSSSSKKRNLIVNIFAKSIINPLESGMDGFFLFWVESAAGLHFSRAHPAESSIGLTQESFQLTSMNE